MKRHQQQLPVKLMMEQHHLLAELEDYSSPPIIKLRPAETAAANVVKLKLNSSWKLKLNSKIPLDINNNH